MKKRFVLLMYLCACFLFGNITCMAEELPTAAYATQTPKLDGEIDAIWDTTEELEVKYYDGNIASTISGYSKILWTEDTLYFMAEVEDDTLSTSESDSYTNGVNFWVSETWTQAWGYPEDGDWHYFVNQDGVSFDYLKKPEVFEAATCSVKKSETSYVVELKVPLLTDDFQYEENDYIGFNLSIDDDVDGDNVRDAFYSWKTYQEKYWENTADLDQVQLIGAPEVENNEQVSIDYKVIGMVGVGVLVLVGSVVFVVSRKEKHS